MQKQIDRWKSVLCSAKSDREQYFSLPLVFPPALSQDWVIVNLIALAAR